MYNISIYRLEMAIICILIHKYVYLSKEKHRMSDFTEGTPTTPCVYSYEVVKERRYECDCGGLFFKIIGTKLQFKCRGCRKIHEIDILELAHKIKSGEI